MNRSIATSTDQLYESRTISFKNPESVDVDGVSAPASKKTPSRNTLDLFDEANQDIIGTTIDSKKYNRQITLTALASEEGNLLEKRQSLIAKMFTDGLSKSENTQLKYISWQLDRIEDAKYGEQLDELEKIIQLQEKTAEELKQITTQFNRHYASQGKRNDRKFGNRR